jgi:tellurium resistance protein TerD
MATRRGLQKVSIGVGWTIEPSGVGSGASGPQTTAVGLDLDIAAFALGPDGVVASDQDFVFFNNLTACDGAIRLTSDAAVFRGWNEEMTVDTAALPPRVDRVVVAVSSYGGEAPFGRFPAGCVELWDSDAGQLARCDLAAQFPGERALVYADLRRDGSRWVLMARGEPFEGLGPIARSMGVKV